MTAEKRGFWATWNGIPLYVRILGAMILGVIAGEFLPTKYSVDLAIPSGLILRLLNALAPMLILVAVIHALMTAQLEKGTAGRLLRLLVLNTVVAIIIGLFVANVVQPGRFAHLTPETKTVQITSDDPMGPRFEKFLKDNNFQPAPDKPGFLKAFLENVPKSMFGPLADDGKVIGVIFIAVAFGIALRNYREAPLQTVESLIEILLNTLIQILHWVIALVPLGIFGIVASIIGKEGFKPVLALGAFVGSVLLALFLQATYYLLRIRFGSWVRPFQLISGTRDALVMAFSTASSTVTMPVTYSALKDRVGLRERSAGLGALVGSNFNNDGTALYEAMAALFISQMLGPAYHLSLPHQLLVVLTSILASVGAAGIPEAGLVTMTLVFSAVHLPVEYIAILLTVDWFLDRCRTMINVMGDMNVSCMLDGKQKETEAEKQEAARILTLDGEHLATPTPALAP